ncbi:cell wall anchor protein, partial [Klebsiella oxytoca]
MFLLALAAALALTVPARADLMWEPHSNHFFEQHRGSCQYEDRGYLANGEAGFVTLWDAP